MARFYLPINLEIGQRIELSIEISKHIQVFRMQPGQTITLFNGNGGQYQALIEQIGKKRVTVTIKNFNLVNNELKVNLELWAAIINMQRMDWLIEKATELGVTKIRPLQTTHSAFRLKADKLEKKQQHWQAVAIAAAQQCGRNQIPQIKPPIDFPQVLQKVKQLNLPNKKNRVLLLSLQQQPTMIITRLQQTNLTTNWTVICGPEGGFTDTEEQQLLQLGCEDVWLGNRVLRSETAAISALSVIGNLVG